MNRSFLGASLLATSVLAAGCLPQQDWEEIDSVSQELSGTFRLQAVSSGKCVDVSGVSTADGALVHQWTCHGRANQQWRVRNLGGNVHQLVAVHSDKCLDLQGANDADGTPVQQWSCGSDSDNQRFRLINAGSGVYNLQVVSSDKCLAVEGGSGANRARIVQDGCVSSTAQQFRFARQGGTTPPPTNPPPNNPPPTNPPPNDPGGLTWRKANLTWFESYPDPGSRECVEFNGCMWAGQFAALPGKQTEEWVRTHNIAAVHSRDFNALKLKTLRLRKNGKTIDVVVYDMCADSDCSGCCTQNANRGGAGFLIDIEKYTAQRFGEDDGQVEWACIDC